MTVHNVQIHVSRTAPDGSSIDAQAEKTTVQNWIDNHDEVLTEQSATFSAGNTRMDGSGTPFYAGSWRFSMAKDRGDILSGIESYLPSTFEWAAIQYHNCSHDEDDPSPCSWDYRWEFDGGGAGQAVPSDLRQFLDLDGIPEEP